MLVKRTYSKSREPWFMRWFVLTDIYTNQAFPAIFIQLERACLLLSMHYFNMAIAYVIHTGMHTNTGKV